MADLTIAILQMTVCGRTRAVGRLGTILKEPCPGAARDDHQGRRPPVAKEDNANKKKEVSKGTKKYHALVIFNV